MDDVIEDPATATVDDTGLSPFVFDVASIPGHTNVEMMGDSPEAEHFLELLGGTW